MSLELTEITGDSGHYFTLAELRAFATELASTTKYTDLALAARREEAEADFEELAHRAFVPRTAQTAYARGGGDYLYLPFRDIRSVTSVTDSDGDAVDITDVKIDKRLGALYLEDGWDADLMTVVYAHGLDEPPASVKRAVMLLAKIYAIPTAIDPRATAVINTDIGGYRLSVAGKDGMTGIPDVDAAAARYGDRVPAVG